MDPKPQEARMLPKAVYGPKFFEADSQKKRMLPKAVRRPKPLGEDEGDINIRVAENGALGLSYLYGHWARGDAHDRVIAPLGLPSLSPLVLAVAARDAL